MMYSVKELEDLLQVSNVTIYKKIKLKEMEPFIVKNKGVTYITEDGLKLIKDNLSYKAFEGIVKNKDEIENDKAIEEVAISVENEGFKDELEGYKTLINSLESQIKTLNDDKEKLWLQLQEKDKQISEILLRLEQTSKIVENSQVLLREKANDPLLLEERFNSFECKLDEVKERMNQRHYEKKSFWDNFRK